MREHFFGKYPETRELVASLSDDDIWNLNRGGHDPFKVYAAYAAAVKHKGQPTVILAKTVKGYGMGESGEGQMIRPISRRRWTRTRCGTSAIASRSRSPTTSSPRCRITAPGRQSGNRVHAGAAQRAGWLPAAAAAQVSVARRCRPLANFERLLQSSGEREISTTMAFVQMLGTLVRDKTIGKHVVPIVPDEARTFGMEGMFRQIGIYSPVGQLYKPQDADQLMYYREDKKGQVLQEGINEAGAMAPGSPRRRRTARTTCR